VSFVIVRRIFRGPKINAKLLKKTLFLQALDIRRASVSMPSLTASPSSSTARLPLQERSVVVSDRIDIKGLKTRFGCPEWQATNTVCTVTAHVADQLVELGAVITATVPSSPLGFK
jgi:Asp-tRNA(Asn)/Glu-tRNA(Gln) amidotransferase A subunit family amidase